MLNEGEDRSTPMGKSSSVPIIDLSAFFLDEPEQAQNAANDLVNACHNLGFAYIAGHGVSSELLQEAFDWSDKLFRLPHDDKVKAPHPPGPIPHRGYSHPGLEKVYSKQEMSTNEAEESKGNSLRKTMDFKESYEIGSDSNPAQPNIWLPEETLPGFRAFMTKFYWELNETAETIMQAFSLGLHLSASESDIVMKLHSGHNNQLRLLHYPPIPVDQLESQVMARMPAHTDWSSFTLLFQDSCGGLELENPRFPGSFIAATPVPDTLILNIGDMLQRITNDTLKSATHRVTLPPLIESTSKSASQSTRARYSIPYFFSPDDDAMIETLPSKVDIDGGHSAMYEPIRYSEYSAHIAKYSYQKDGGGGEEV